MKADPLLALFAIKLEDIQDEVVEIFEDNWSTFCLFDSMSTQWRVGMVGATGLDYNVIPFVAKSLGIEESEYADVLPGVRIMESEALLVMSEERERENKK